MSRARSVRLAEEQGLRARGADAGRAAGDRPADRGGRPGGAGRRPLGREPDAASAGRRPSGCWKPWRRPSDALLASHMKSRRWSPLDLPPARREVIGAHARHRGGKSRCPSLAHLARRRHSPSHVATPATGARGQQAGQGRRHARRQAWAAIGDFCGIGTGIRRSRNACSARRTASRCAPSALKGGGTIVEEQIARDEAGCSYTYAIIESPLPVANYESTIAVEQTGGYALIVWTGKFAAKGAPDADADRGDRGHLPGRARLAGEPRSRC